MKKTICVALFALIGLLLAAQAPEDCHFYVEDGSIFWRQVFESPADSNTLLDHLFGSGNFADITEVSNGVSFTIAPRKINTRAGGFKAGSVAMYVANYTMTAHGILEMREGRYRVTVDRIVFQAGPDTTLETYALNKRMEFKPVFVSMNAAKAIDYELTRLFTIKAAEREDW